MNGSFTCPRCGNEVNNSARYCMKCGYLNPNHPDNTQYSQLIGGSNNHSQGIQPSNNGLANNPFSAKGAEVGFGNKMGNFTLCFAVNLICYLLLICGVVFIFYSMNHGELKMMMGSELCYILFSISLFSLFQYSVQLVYMKMNKRWWLALIPFVNLYVLSDAICEKTALNFLVFVPVVGQIYLLFLLYKMGEAFKTSSFLTLLFPFIMFPVIGFGGHSFRGICYVSGRDTLESEYGKKKSFLILNVIIIVVSIVMFFYANTMSINRGIDRFSSYYIYYASQRVIRRTKLKVENGVYECDNENSNVLYFYFSDLSDYFSIPFYVYRAPIQAYVKVVIIPGANGGQAQYDYYISMTDLRYGIPETKVEEVTVDSVQPFEELDPAYQSGNQCNFRRNA